MSYSIFLTINVSFHIIIILCGSPQLATTRFGSFAGQLGDGAAMYLGEIVNDESGQRWEIQLKGAGKTPYSRMADGRKVLRSTVREFLCSEAIHFLGIPTTRAGTCVTSDSYVIRDIFYDGHPINERCSVILRIAPTFIRFGSFEIIKAPSQGNMAIIRTLTNYVIEFFYHEIWNQYVPNSTVSEKGGESDDGTSGLTGKTGTTKDLGRPCGVMVYVFNCPKQVDYKSIGNIYKGLAQAGSRGCFDEFNRISIEVLSVVAVQVKCIQDAIRNKKDRFDFLGEKIAMNPSVGIFITRIYVNEIKKRCSQQSIIKSCRQVEKPRKSLENGENTQLLTCLFVIFSLARKTLHTRTTVSRSKVGRRRVLTASVTRPRQSGRTLFASITYTFCTLYLVDVLYYAKCTRKYISLCKYHIITQARKVGYNIIIHYKPHLSCTVSGRSMDARQDSCTSTNSIPEQTLKNKTQHTENNTHNPLHSYLEPEKRRVMFSKTKLPYNSVITHKTTIQFQLCTKTITVTVPSNSHILNAWHKACTQNNIPTTHDVYFTYQGRNIPPSNTISQLNNNSFCTIQVMIRSRGGMFDEEGARGEAGDEKSAYNIKFQLQPFIRKNPKLWFRQVESNFKVHRITNDRIRYHAVYAVLPEDIALDIPDEMESYEELKGLVLNVTDKSNQEKMQEALGECTLDGRRPSQFIRHARNKLREVGLDPTDDLLKNRLLHAMPQDARLTLTGQEHLPLDSYCSIADNIYDLLERTKALSVTHVHKQNNNNESRHNNSYQSRNTTTSTKSTPRGNHGYLPYAEGQRQKICRAHLYFAEKARSCKTWCRWPGPKPERIEPSSTFSSANSSRTSSPVPHQLNH